METLRATQLLVSCDCGSRVGGLRISGAIACSTRPACLERLDHRDSFACDSISPLDHARETPLHVLHSLPFRVWWWRRRSGPRTHSPIRLGVRCGGSKATARLALPQPWLEVYKRRSRACRYRYTLRNRNPPRRAPSDIVGVSTIHCFIPDPHPWIPNQRGIDANGESEMMSEPEVARDSSMCPTRRHPPTRRGTPRPS